MITLNNLRFLIILPFLFHSVLFSATRYVTSNSTSSSGGLAYEIAQASSGDVVEIQNNIVISAQISISKTITINGNGNSISVQTPGVDDNGVNNTSPSTHRLFSVTGNSITVTLNNIRLRGGDIMGGCIYNTAKDLVLNRVILSNGRNSMPGAPQYSQGGGAIHNAGGTIYMNECQLIRNSAGFGGGFVNNGGTMYVEQTTFAENRSEISNGGGGGCENKSGGTLVLNNCTFSNNKSTERGGGINNNGSGSKVYVLNSTFTGNVAYGSTYGGALDNRSDALVLNCIFAYNYSITSGNFSSPTSYRLDDFSSPGGNGTQTYYSIYHASVNSFLTGSNGNIPYGGDPDGSDNDIFAGGIYTKITDGTGSEIGTAKVFQPYLVSNLTKTATLQLGSFPNQSSNKGVVTGFTPGNGTISIGYKNPSTGSWVNLLNSAASNNVVTVDQLDSTRSNTPTRGSVETEINTVYMLKVLKGTNGSSTGGSLYGDIYESGEQVTLTAFPNTGYRFSYWKNVNSGNSVSTSNPWTLTITKDSTVEPVFVTSTNYSVTYIGNNQTNGNAPSVQSFTTGGSVTLSGKNTLYKDEYYFNGWNTNATGTGTNFSPGTVYSTSSNLTLYAVWVPYVKYYVKSGSTSSLNATSSWSGTKDGTGGSPTNFANDKIFILSNTAGSTSFTTGGTWTVEGAVQIPVGATLNISSNTTTTFSNDVTNEGVIIGGSGSTLVLDGTDMQFVGGRNQLINLVCDNSAGITFTDSTDIYESLELLQGTLFPGNKFTFKSNATKTAILKPVVNGASVSGNVTVERYFPAKRAYRLVSSAVSSSGSIRENWQEAGRTKSGLGTHITGSTNGADGLDATLTGNTSLFVYNNSSSSWVALTNTSVTKLNRNTPYRLMIRGDRTVSLATNTPPPTNTILRAKGTLGIGTINMLMGNQGSGDNLFVANPYQSPVDLNTVVTSSSKIDNDVWFWDPQLSTRGAYVSVDVSTNTTTNSSSAANKFLQPGQAFFAIATGSEASVTFSESAKGNSFTNTFRTTVPDAKMALRLFHKDSFATEATSCDGITAYFSKEYSNGVDFDDVVKLNNLDETLSWLLDGKTLAKQNASLPESSSVMPLSIKQYREKNYVLVVDFEGELTLQPYLFDKILNLQYRIDAGQNDFFFDVLAPGSDASDRFQIVFKEKSTSNVYQVYRSEVQVHPNPSENHQIQVVGFMSSDPVKIEVLDVHGRTVHKQSLPCYLGLENIQLPVNLSPACYTLLLNSKSQSVTCKLILK